MGKQTSVPFIIVYYTKMIQVTVKIFFEKGEPFYMVDKSRARKQGGAGLGLFLCQRIVNLHDGELRIKSKTGEGTHAVLYLNLEEAT